jgi:protein-S-isoprenylcysteine O-methyltransferase Ste14
MAIDHCSGNLSLIGSYQENTINSENKNRSRQEADRSQASQRVALQRNRWRRMARTILLGTTTALAGVVWVAQQYGVAVSDSLAFLGSSVVFVLGLIAVALAAACLLWVVRKLLGR